MNQEEELIQQAKNGDTLALSMLMQKHYDFLVHYLMKITFNPHVAEELAQETMVRMMEKIKLYNGKSKFSSWLITIATHLYIDQQRKKKREIRWQEEEQHLRKLRWQMGQRNEDWFDTVDALSLLTYKIRLPIILKYYYGYSLEEIGEMMEIPLGTVKSRIHNGLKSLRKELKIDG